MHTKIFISQTYFKTFTVMISDATCLFVYTCMLMLPTLSLSVCLSLSVSLCLSLSLSLSLSLLPDSLFLFVLDLRAGSVEYFQEVWGLGSHSWMDVCL